MTESRKIGGWIWLLALQLIATILIATYGLKNYVVFYLSTHWHEVLANPNLHNFKPLFYSETTLFLFQIIGGAFLITIFLNKKFKFRDYYILYMIVAIIGYGVTYLFAQKVPILPVSKLTELLSGVISYLIWTIIWSLYLFKSKRVELTFKY